MISNSSSADFLITESIPYVTADEAHDLLHTELDRLLSIVGTLDIEDWGKPTACTEWTVRDVLAHQAGAYASGVGYMEMLRQGRNRPKPGQLVEDAINAFQLQERIDKSPAELIEEIRWAGPTAIEKWASQFRLIKLVTLPHPVAGKLSFRHLMWVIHSRDTWMHRLDISRATGREFEVTPEHDGRIAELIMLDVADVLQRKTHNPAMIFDLTGDAGGSWKIGQGEPVARIQMDVLEFNIYASGRYTYELARPMATITGDVGVAEEAFDQILVVY